MAVMIFTLGMSHMCRKYLSFIHRDDPRHQPVYQLAPVGQLGTALILLPLCLFFLS